MKIKHRAVTAKEYHGGNQYTDTGRLLVAVFSPPSGGRLRVETNTFIGFNADLSLEQAAGLGACFAYAAQFAADFYHGTAPDAAFVEIADEKNFPQTAEEWSAEGRR